jgi:hypothetical protein
MACDKLVRCIAITVLAPAFSEHVFLVSFGAYLIPTNGIVVVALNLFGRDRRHLAACNRPF